MFRLYREILEQLAIEEADRREWINGLADKYGIVRMAGSLTADERARQQAMLEWAFNRRFLVTTPLPGLERDWDGNWHRTEPI
jgi:hypothetical protein